MPLQDDEAPRLAEIGRRITQVGENLNDFRHEVRANLTEMVRRDLYIAERDAIKERLVALEQGRKSLQALVYGGLVAIVVSIVTMWMGKGAQ